MFIKRFLFLISIIIKFLFDINILFDDSYSNKELYFDYNYQLKKNFNISIAKGKVKNNILFKFYIPRINLEKDVYTIDSGENDIDYNIEILEGSDMDKNLFFLAAHSGSGSASYFNELVDLDIGDIILIEKNNIKKYFVIKDKFYITKNGYFEYFSFENRLYLITCSLDYLDKQLVVESILIS